MTEKRVVKTPTIDFKSPLGAPAYLHPSSVHWRVFKNRISFGMGGITAVLLEFADPRIRSGVWDHSVYHIDPLGRSERTAKAAMVGVYGPKEAARTLIGGVTRMHAKVSGKTPDGQAYKALDPALLNWVSATATYGFIKAYTEFVTPLSSADEHRYWNSGHEIPALYGVTHCPKSEADFLDMMNELAPGFEAHPITFEFLDIIESGKAAPYLPNFVHRAMARGAVSLLPQVVRSALKLGPRYDLTLADRTTLRLLGQLAERYCNRNSPHAQACERLGLPANFLYRSEKEQERLLAKAHIVEPTEAPTTSAVAHA